MSDSTARHVVKPALNLTLQGIAGSPGIAIGKAYLVEQEDVDVIEKRFVEPEDIAAEIRRFKGAVKKAQRQLQRVIDEVPEEFRDHIYILDAHMMLLKDKMIHNGTIEHIERENVNAEWALKMAVDEVKSIFKKMPDPYFRERASDVTHASKLILGNLLGTGSSNISHIDKRVIVVAHDLSPAETTQMQLEKVKAFLTDLGGKTSHTGIIARSLEIPAVLGLGNAKQLIKTDDLLIVDGSAGVVILDPDEETLTRYQERKDLFEQYQAMITRSSHLPAETTDGFCLMVMANIGLLEDVVSVIDHGGDGIGLYRTEFLYLNRPTLPSEQDLFDNYRDVAEIMAPRTVTIRTLDIGGDKFASGLQLAEEMNPALGLRAIRFSLWSPEIFKTQLRAILRAANLGNVRIMFPMISEVDEIIQAKQMLNEAAESLDKAGVPFRADIEVGAMIEVPSAVIMADVLAREVDFFSIGTNDLIQYSLAIDRINKQVAHLYQPLHPAVLRMIQRVVEAAREAGIQVYMCGEMAGDPVNLPVLLGMELDAISMNPISIPVVKKMVRMLSLKESKQFLKEALKQVTAADVLNLIQDTYGPSFPKTDFFQPSQD
ncbi:MAG: phosphoenolpyruvate--protein phosphotransferase [Deltaproteobacteria bacterium]|nr:phosphoenolpyruvate--protein phosphotransferase [Deltaproteobacteria bacterium]MBW2074488.1 phosphoenolpyruvate--protein phosphotransferase [Deltaproteobacteria bacterium]